MLGGGPTRTRVSAAPFTPSARSCPTPVPPVPPVPSRAVPVSAPASADLRETPSSHQVRVSSRSIPSVRPEASLRWMPVTISASSSLR